MRNADLARFIKLPLIGILRGIEESELPCLVDACISTGLDFVEITMNTPRAPHLIRHLVELAEGRFVVGAGTVLTRQELDEALTSGAGFIVSPVLVPEVVTECVQRGLLVFPGAFTPEEIYRAHLAGASMVKVFPSHFLGPEYIAELKGPFSMISLLACGGIRPHNAEAYFARGVDGVAVGASVFRREWLARRDTGALIGSLSELIEAVRRGTSLRA